LVKITLTFEKERKEWENLKVSRLGRRPGIFLRKKNASGELTKRNTDLMYEKRTHKSSERRIDGDPQARVTTWQVKGPTRRRAGRKYKTSIRRKKGKGSLAQPGASLSSERW